MPKILAKSISILSDAGLGMAMFSLGEWCANFVNLLGPPPPIINFERSWIDIFLNHNLLKINAAYSALGLKLVAVAFFKPRGPVGSST